MQASEKRAPHAKVIFTAMNKREKKVVKTSQIRKQSNLLKELNAVRRRKEEKTKNRKTN